MLKISDGRLITGGKIINADLYIENGKIAAVTNEKLPYEREINARGCYVSAGFIDIHTHGGSGIDFMDGGASNILTASETHIRHGATTIYPTSIACGFTTLLDFLADVETAMTLSEEAVLKTDGAFVPHIAGAHLEGPYFNVSQAGAQNPDYIKPPDKDEYESVISKFGGVVKRWSFAPELEGAIPMCEYLAKHGVVTALAHSAAVYEDILPVYERGMKLTVHLYSGMTGVVRKNGYRYLGGVETAYLLDGMRVEAIADGHHLPTELLKLIYKIKGSDSIVLVSDSMRGAGCSDGASLLGRIGEGMECIIENGVAKLPDRSAFAGSVATADTLVRTMLKAEVPLAEAITMITANPAAVMGLKNKGDIFEKADADIVIFDDDINICCVIRADNTARDGASYRFYTEQ